MVHVLTQPHSSGEDVTVISESEAWWKYGHLLHVVYIVVVIIVIRVLRVYYYSLPRNGFIKTGNYYSIIYISKYTSTYVLHYIVEYMRVSDLNRSLFTSIKNILILLHNYVEQVSLVS